jgi:hypothetical protein
MKKLFIPAIIVLMLFSCRNEKPSPANSSAYEQVPAGSITVAKDIVTEVIVKPDTLGDPWEVEKVAGYNGKVMIDNIFKSIYEGKLIAKDYHSGIPLKIDEVKDFEKEFNDRSMIGKISFTEDWYYDPATSIMVKKVKSMAFGYELRNNEGNIFGYKAVFAIEPVK